MTFTYEFGKADARAFLSHHGRFSHPFRALRWPVCIHLVLILGVALVAGLYWRTGRGPLVAAALAYSLVFLLVVVFVYEKRRSKTTSRLLDAADSANVFGRRTVELTREHLRIQWPEGETAIPWSTIVKVTRTSDHIFAYRSDDEAVVIPRASLEGASFDDVWTRVNECLSPNDEDDAPR